MDGERRAGVDAQAVHEGHLQPLDLQQVQADEMRIKLQGRVVLWGALAIMVSPRLWLGAVVSERRDRQLIGALAVLVRRWAQKVALYITFDGFAAYRDAFERAFSDKRPGLSGRSVHCVWPCLTLAQVVKHKTNGAFQITGYVLPGWCTLLLRLRTAPQGEGPINTAFIERLNGTARAYLAPLVRCTHGLARTQQTVTCAVFLLGCVYNFCRLHATLKHSTPAMAANLTDHVWSVAELLWYRPLALYINISKMTRHTKRITVHWRDGSVSQRSTTHKNTGYFWDDGDLEKLRQMVEGDTDQWEILRAFPDYTWRSLQERYAYNFGEGH